jgi:hypothetical protein
MESRTERLVAGSALRSRRQMKQQERRPADPGAAPNAGCLKTCMRSDLPNRCTLRCPNSTERTL